jgi:hypothetical protein
MSRSSSNGISRLALIAALVAFGAFGLAAVLLLTDSDAATQRLGLLFALFGSIVAALISALRADKAATQTDQTSQIASALDGMFDARVSEAMRRVIHENPATRDVLQEQAHAKRDTAVSEALREQVRVRDDADREPEP